MKYDIDFSIFASPTRPYGNVTGMLEFAALPQPGAVVAVLAERLERDEGLFCPGYDAP